MKIRSKLIIIFLTLSLIPVYLGSFALYGYSKAALARAIANHLDGTASIQKERTNALLDHFISDLGLIASKTQMRLSLARYNRTGEQSIRRLLSRNLRDTKNSTGDILEITIFGTDGHAVASSDPLHEGRAVMDERFFLQGRKTCGLIDIVSEQTAPGLLLSCPLMLDNRLLGVIRITGDGRKLVEVTRDFTGLGKTGETTLSKKDEGGNAVFIVPLRFDEKAAFNRTIAGNNSSSPFIRALQKSEAFSGDAVDYRGVPVLSATRFIERTGWGLVVKMDRAEAFAPVERMRNLLQYGLAGLTLVLISVVLCLSRSITRPLSLLTAAAGSISEGRVTQKVTVESEDEIGALAHTFNRMSDSIAQARQALNDKVRELEDEVGERRVAEGALQHAKEFNETVINSMNDSVYIINVHDLTITSANRIFLDKMRLTEDEVRGKTCHEVTHHRDVPCAPPEDPCPLFDTLKTGEARVYEHVHLDSDGNKIYVEVSTSPLRNDKGEITHVVHVDRDISDRKRLEDQLRHSQKLEAVGHLAGGIAHDFNNILTAIMGYGSLVRMKMQDSDPLRTFIDSILSSAERAANLTRSLLAFSRKQIINPKPVDVNDIVNRVEKLLLRLIGEDIELKTLLSGAPLTVLADSGQIEQVLMNLATNARDAMPDGGLLTIETRYAELTGDYTKGHLFAKGGKCAQISVTDTGAGMDETTRQNIFEPFFTTKDIGKGTGLGLSIVYGIVKQHNGNINVYSEPGRGTTFKIYLPLLNVGIEKTEGPSESKTPLKGGTETLLLAEDDAEVRNITREVLTGFGYTVLEASDGNEALDVFREHAGSIRMLILDVIMPRRNGREVYEEIKKLDPSIRALFTSGYTMEVIHRKGILEGDLNFISKPAAPDELLRKVREVLDA